jgi:hypothetical protein
MDFFYQSCVEMVLATLHHVTFIEPFAVLSTEALSFHSNQFTNNYANKIYNQKNEDYFFLLEEHFFDDAVVVCKKSKKNYDIEFEDLPHEVVEFFFVALIPVAFFCCNKVFQKKLSRTIFVLQMNSVYFMVE